MDEEIKNLLEKNLELNKELLERVKKINRYITWQQVFGALKILLIVVPIIIGFIYLPAILKNAFAPYKELLNQGQGAKANILEGIGAGSKVPNSFIDKFLK